MTNVTDKQDSANQSGSSHKSFLPELCVFTTNVGKTDRIVRLIAGVAVVALGVVYSNWFGLIGVVLIGTAFVRWCPAYVPFKISTCAVETPSE